MRLALIVTAVGIVSCGTPAKRLSSLQAVSGNFTIDDRVYDAFADDILRCFDVDNDGELERDELKTYLRYVTG